MFQLIYISTAHPSVDQHEVSRILARSRTRNEADCITGLLVFDGKRFLQALEGERGLVHACYDRILLDPFHRAALTLSEREIQEREFGDWTMAWTRVDIIDGKLPLGDLVDSLVEQASDPNTRALFRGFARIERKAA